MQSFLKVFLPIYLVAYFALAFFWRSFLIYKRTGINPYKLGNTDNARDFIGFLFRLVVIALVIVVMIFLVWSDGYKYLAPITWLEQPVLIWLGIGLLIISLVLTLLAQIQMGNSWRIGIDRDVKTQLVSKGVFALSCNPIFLGLRLTLSGLFLVLPNAVTLALLFLGDALMRIQVRLEEEFLLALHDADYRNYQKRVRRWL